MVASSIRTLLPLAVAVGSALLSTAGAKASTLTPDPYANSRTSLATASILEPAAPPQLRAPISRSGPATAIDGEGRNLSVSLPSTVRLYGITRADELAARTVIAPAGAGVGRLALTLDQPVRNAATAGAYVGVLRLSLDYN